MKRMVLALLACGTFLSALAQADSTKTEKPDTIKVGGIIIVKKKGKDNNGNEITVRQYGRSNRSSNRNLSTNWIVFDLGFTNLNDNTDYAAAIAQGFAQPGFSKDNMKLHATKSVDVNIWLFMQKLNVIKHVVNLKYGIGIELNNYRFDDKRVKLEENPTRFTIKDDWKDLIKNKLAADYITVPFMVNFDFTPQRRRGFGFSVGVSAGYLYSGRQKIKYSNGDKEKFYDDFDLRPFKISYIGELSLGPIRLYGSYATRSMWEKGFNQRPYNFGIRFSHW